jgi:prepilin signal peptidase PulO-like enzyme (type II secretory pathway)
METHIATLVLTSLLALAAAIDIRSMRIPDALNAALIGIGVGATLWLGKPITPALIGVVVGYGALFAANLAYRAARGRDGLGMGDAKLLAGAGAWLGWSGLPFVVLIASALGLAYVAALRIGGRTLARGDALAFGPFLCAGVGIVWLVQAYS